MMNYNIRARVGGNNIITAKQQQQLTRQLQQFRLTMQSQEKNAQQGTVSMAQPAHSQPRPQVTVSCISQSVPIQALPQTVTTSIVSVSVSSATQQINLSPVQNNVFGAAAAFQHKIWKGTVEWIEKLEHRARTLYRYVQCQIFSDGDPEVKADTWPSKLIMQLIPKQLTGNIGDSYLKNSKSVLFRFTPCEALESLTKMMSAGYVGCISVPSIAACKIKVLFLLPGKIKRNTYVVGVIPNDQTALVDHLQKILQQQEMSNASMKQTSTNDPLENTIPVPMPAVGASHTQEDILMSQTNTMAMDGSQITQNVVSTNEPSQTSTTNSPQVKKEKIEEIAISISSCDDNSNSDNNSDSSSSSSSSTSSSEYIEDLINIQESIRIIMLYLSSKKRLQKQRMRELEICITESEKRTLFEAKGVLLSIKKKCKNMKRLEKDIKKRKIEELHLIKEEKFTISKKKKCCLNSKN